jgi:hypothetical protein
MKKLLPILLILLFPLISEGQSNVYLENERYLSLLLINVHSLDIDGDFVVYVRQTEYGEDCSISINDYSKNDIKGNIKKGVLKLTNENNEKLYVIHLAVKNLKSIKAKGKTKIRTTSHFDLTSTQIELGESSILNLSLQSGYLACDIKGQGEVSITGVVNDMDLRLADGVTMKYTAHSDHFICDLKNNAALSFASEANIKNGKINDARTGKEFLAPVLFPEQTETCFYIKRKEH